MYYTYPLVWFFYSPLIATAVMQHMFIAARLAAITRTESRKVRVG